jgi:hypothetical protein
MQTTFLCVESAIMGEPIVMIKLCTKSRRIAPKHCKRFIIHMTVLEAAVPAFTQSTLVSMEVG